VRSGSVPTVAIATMLDLLGSRFQGVLHARQPVPIATESANIPTNAALGRGRKRQQTASNPSAIRRKTSGRTGQMKRNSLWEMIECPSTKTSKAKPCAWCRAGGTVRKRGGANTVYCDRTQQANMRQFALGRLLRRARRAGTGDQPKECHPVPKKCQRMIGVARGSRAGVGEAASPFQQPKSVMPSSLGSGARVRPRRRREPPHAGTLDRQAKGPVES
jgi:hypothetical protein